MTKDNKNQYLTTAIKCAERAGDILIDFFEKIESSTQKNQNKRDIVTNVDLLSEEAIKSIIQAEFPSDGIVAEESAPQSSDDSAVTWYIDPIDGTVNYQQGIKYCCISIAAARNGKPFLGVVFNPFTNEMFYAVEGEGAFLNGNPIKVSSKETFSEGLYSVGFSSDRSFQKKSEYEVFSAINDTTYGVLRTGSAALNLANVASSKHDGFWSVDLHPWDLAAGIALIREAGGVVLSENGDYTLGDKLCIATSETLKPKLFEQVSILQGEK